jgi:hypothetical protein
VTQDIDLVEEYLREAFEENYELLRLEGAGALSPGSRLAAFHEVLAYWRKMRDIAQSVTDTEVKLTLPGQTTPGGRPFSIHGIVDIVREQGRTVMYDIKTHDADHVRDHTEEYEGQLNVYAYIWQHLRGEPLDETAVIATKCPERVREALLSEDSDHIAYALASWDPLVVIPFSEERVRETVSEFAAVVDAIEDGAFEARPASELGQRSDRTRRLVVIQLCADCDARFSCQSYRTYAAGGGGEAESQFRMYFSDLDQEAWQTAGLDSQPDPDDLRIDLT